jgi:hypothetical protein
MSDQVRWFDPLGRCMGCGKAATGTLRGPRNESYGNTCARCGEARVRRAGRERAREAMGKMREAK